MIGEDKVIKFTGCQRNEACSIVLRGSGNHILDEAERSLHDAICVLISAVKNHKIIWGGGNAEVRMSLASKSSPTRSRESNHSLSRPSPELS